jgi:hypothetical protein
VQSYHADREWQIKSINNGQLAINNGQLAIFLGVSAESGLLEILR